jgi:hypothetical protein
MSRTSARPSEHSSPKPIASGVGKNVGIQPSESYIMCAGVISMSKPFSNVARATKYSPLLDDHWWSGGRLRSKQHRFHPVFQHRGCCTNGPSILHTGGPKSRKRQSDLMAVFELHGVLISSCYDARLNVRIEQSRLLRMLPTQKETRAPPPPGRPQCMNYQWLAYSDSFIKSPIQAPDRGAR